jgi:hypothetical protein
LALEQGDDGKWRVEFDEEWARNGANRTAEPTSEPVEA